MSCIICNSKTTFFLFKEGYSYNKCPACELVFVNPLPEEEHLHKEVYSKKAGYQKNRKKIATKENRHIKKILTYLEKQFPREVGVKSVLVPRLLDVGCSNGDFLYFAKLRGFDPYGVEVNELTAEVAQSRGLDVKQGTLEEAAYPNDFFDAIFLGDVIEHVKDPAALLAESFRILKKDGTLIISTPNLDSFWARATFKSYKWFNIPWSVLTPPHHLFQFSEDNLKQFLKENGFTPVGTWFRRPPILKYELGSLHLWGKWKQEKTFKSFFFMLFSFAVYTKLYVLDTLITPFKEKDFGMITVYKKL
ncbi:MAG: class I SAM-dependent methyltransferase [Parcubacteria group bacterium]|nr:class I SAM-dependent methyltransferase [Parcubacteria group bacterium]